MAHSDRPVARESPSITIANHFLSEKARISVYDPQVTESQIWLDLTE
jgi:UDPglucose 6-dehydrogenase